MNRTQTVASRILALVLVLGATISTPANALVHFPVHRNPADPQDTRVTVHILNNANIFRDVEVDGHIYTVLPHQLLEIKAPSGESVYTETTGGLHHKGDLLFKVDPKMQGSTIKIN